MYPNIFLKNTLSFFLVKFFNFLQLKIKYAEGTKPPILSILKVKLGNLICKTKAVFNKQKS